MSFLEPASRAKAACPIQTDRQSKQHDYADTNALVSPDKQVLFIDDLANLFGTSRRTIDRRRKVGTFPITELPPIDNKPRWSRAAVMRFLSESFDTKLRNRPLTGARTGRL